MLKYRLLTDDELKELEHEFKQFLIVNEIYDEEWRKLNAEKNEKVGELVIMFSNLVIEKSLKRIQYLEIATSEGINAYHCKDDEIELIGISTQQTGIDFLSLTPNELSTTPLSIFMTSKKYEKERETTIFEMLNSGCGIIDEKRFGQLKLAYEYSTKPRQN